MSVKEILMRKTDDHWEAHPLGLGAKVTIHSAEAASALDSALFLLNGKVEENEEKTPMRIVHDDKPDLTKTKTTRKRRRTSRAWEKSELALLGTTTDKKLGQQFRRTEVAVRAKRNLEGVKSYRTGQKRRRRKA